MGEVWDPPLSQSPFQWGTGLSSVLSQISLLQHCTFESLVAPTLQRIRRRPRSTGRCTPELPPVPVLHSSLSPFAILLTPVGHHWHILPPVPAAAAMGRGTSGHAASPQGLNPPGLEPLVEPPRAAGEGAVPAWASPPWVRS